MRVLLVAPYYGGSHRAWAAGYAQHSTHQVGLLTLPARFWKWRMQGSALTLAYRVGDLPPPDLVLATDMLNLPVFLGLARQRLADVPVAMYCHENQLTYPIRPGERRDLTYAMINWLSMVAADRIFFNSSYHRDDWFEALPRLLKHFPDHVHLDWMPGVRARSEVMPVGCDLVGLNRAREQATQRGPPLILWNQRWEYDKDPTAFFCALDQLVERGIVFRVALAGSNMRQMPEEFESARRRLGKRVVHYGRSSRDRYEALLWEADIVVSTARHEFFGIAIVEAMYCGCFPLLPHRLAYPEVLPTQYHDACLYESFPTLVDRLSWAVTHCDEAQQLVRGLHEAMGRFDWHVVARRYDAALERVSAAA